MVRNYSKNYDYTGSYQEFVAPVTADYKIEAWGASGGKDNWTGTLLDNGSNGGYSSGTINLTKGEKIYIYVGEQGEDGKYGTPSTLNNPSFNGGGASISAPDNNDSGGSGGGATDIRLVSGTWDNNQSLASRILVAGGGSGGGTVTNSFTRPAGGSGGGVSAKGSIWRYPGTEIKDHTYNATQTTGYSFGYGENGYAANNAGGAGAGGGYYGGYADTEAGGAGGGSGYISGHVGSVAIQAEDNTNPKYGCDNGTTDITCSYHYSGKKFTDTVMKSGNEYVPSYNGNDTTLGNKGNGHVKITFAYNTDDYETSNEKFDELVSSLNVVDYYDINTYKSSNVWKSKQGTDAEIIGDIIKENNSIRVNNFDTRNYVKMSIDNTGDTIIYGLVKVNRNYNTNAKKIFEIPTYDYGSSYTIPMIYAYNNSLCVDSYNFSRCYQNYDFDQYNLITMSIDNSSKIIDLYINGEFIFDISFDSYGDVLYLSNSIYNQNELGDNSYKMVAIGNSIPSSDTIRSNSLKILEYYNGTAEKVIVKKEAEYETNDSYQMNDYITDGLKLHYDALNVGETEGVIEDISGNNNDGTISNTIIDNGSIEFNGNASVTLENSPITITDSETVEVMFSTNSSGNQIFYNGSSNQKIGIGTWSGYVIVANQSAGSYTYKMPQNLSDGKPHTISVVYSDGSYKAYFDDTEMTINEVTNYWGSDANLYLGKRGPNGPSFFTGKIYNVKVYDRALRLDEMTRNYNVNITRYYAGSNIKKRVATLDPSYQNGKITSSTYSSIYNENGAFLNIKEAIVEINKEGYYNAVENHGMLTMEDDGYINTLKRYNRGIYNSVNGDIINGAGTITTYLGDSNGILNESTKDKGFGGYNLYSTITSSTSIYNKGKEDMTLSDLTITGNGNAIYQFTNKDLAVKDSTLNSDYYYNHSLLTSDNNLEGNITLNNINANNTISNVNNSIRKITINDSTFTGDIGSNYIYNYSGTVDVNGSTFEKTNSGYDIYNYKEMTISDSTFEIPENAWQSGIIRNEDFGAEMTINDSIFNKHLSVEAIDIDRTDWNNRALVDNDKGTLIFDGSEFNSDLDNGLAIKNMGGSLIVKGDFEISDKYDVGIYNGASTYWYKNYSGSLTLGENDSSVSTEYPKINGRVSAIYTQISNAKDPYGAIDNEMYFYDGVLNGKYETTLYSSVSGKPNNYDINSVPSGERETVTLRPTVVSTSTQSTDYVAQIGSNKYLSLQAAVDAVPKNNTETEIDIIKDIATADSVNIDANQNIKINYNNHIVRSHTHDYLYNNNGKVKLYDNTNNVSKTSKSFSIDYLVNNTNCDFNDIKVYALYADSRLVNNDSGTCVINSGYYKSVGTVVNNNSIVTINNGDLLSSNINNCSNLINNSETGTTNINNGYFSHLGGGNTIYNNNILNVHNGTFVKSGEATGIFGNDYNGTLIVDGGSYDNTLKKYNENTGNNLYLVVNYGDARVQDITSKFNGVVNNTYKDVEGVTKAGNATFTNVTASEFGNFCYSGNCKGITNNGEKVVFNDIRLSGSGIIYNVGHTQAPFIDTEMELNGVTYTTQDSYIIDIANSKLKIDKYVKPNNTVVRSVFSASGGPWYGNSYGTGVMLLNGAEVDIEDGDILSTFEGTYGYMVSVLINDGNEHTNLTMKSGNISTSYGAGIYLNNSGTDNSTITIGTKGTPVSIVDPSISGSTYGVYSSNDKVDFNFYDGKIKGETDHAISMRLNENEPGYDIVSEDVSNTQTKYNAIIPAYRNTRTNLEYDTLQEAIDNSSDNDTIIVQREVTILSSALPATNSKKLTIDLNGKKVIMNNEKYIVNTGNLTIKDSTAIADTNGVLKGKGSIESNGGLIVDNSNILKFESGNYYSKFTKIINNDATLTIDNGNFYQTGGINTSLSELIKNGSTAEITVNNGYFKLYSTGETGYINPIFSNDNKITINDGIYELFGYSYDRWVRYVSVVNNNNSNSKTYINGGTYGIAPESYVSAYVLYNKGYGEISNSTSAFKLFVKNEEGTVKIKDCTIGYNSDDMFGISGGAIQNLGTKIEIDGLETLGKLYVSNFIIPDAGEVDIKNSNINVYGEDVLLIRNNSEVLIDNSTIQSTGRTINMNNSSSLTIDNSDSTKSTLIKSTYDSKTGIYDALIYDNSSGKLIVKAGELSAENLYSAITTNENNSPIKTVEIGVKDGTVSSTTPKIKAYQTTIYKQPVNYENLIIKFYDGQLIAKEALKERVDDIETDYYVVSSISNDVETKSLNKTYAASTSTNSYYTLEDAFDHAASTDTITVLRDITTITTDSTITIPNTKNIVLDLNGHTIYQNNPDFINNKGTFEIVDSSQDKKGLIYSLNSYIVNNEGTFTFTSGKMYNPRTQAVMINNSGTYTNAGGNMEFYVPEYLKSFIYNSGTINYNSGIITNMNNRCERETNSFVFENDGTLNLAGGNMTFKAIGGIVNNNGTLNVTGGVYNENSSDVCSIGYLFYNNNDISVTGGTYGASDNYMNKGMVYNDSSSASPAIIQGITLYANNGTSIFYNSNGTLNIDNVTANSTYCMLNSVGGEINVTGGTFNANKFVSSYVNNDSIIATNSIINLTNAIVNFVNEGINTGNNLLHSYNAGIVNINGTTTLTSVNNNIGIDNNGTVNINSGTITSTAANAITIDHGSINIGTQGAGAPSITDPAISGKNYGLYNNGFSSVYFYDGIIKGEDDSIYGAITDTAAGYKEKRDNVSDPNTGVTTVESTLTVVGTSERVAVVNNVNFLSIQSAVNYASNNGIENIQLYKSITLEDNLVKPAGGSNVKIYLGSYVINMGSYTVEAGIDIVNGTAPSASLTRFLASITGQEINPKNIVIFEMSDGSKLDSSTIYKLYKVIDGEEKIVKVKENKIGDYDLGSETENIRTARSRIYINGIGEGTYKLIGSDNKEITFTITHSGISSNIRENNRVQTNRTVSAIATLILQLQTGMIRNPYILIIMILVIGSLGFIAYQKYKRED